MFLVALCNQDLLDIFRQAIRRPGNLNFQAVEELSIKPDHGFYSNSGFDRIIRLSFEEYDAIDLLARVKPDGLARLHTGFLYQNVCGDFTTHAAKNRIHRQSRALRVPQFEGDSPLVFFGSSFQDL